MTKDTQFELPSNEIAFRKIYKNLLESEAITRVFRPGKRACGDFRGYCEGDIVQAKVIDQIGLDRAEVPPLFLPQPVKTIRVQSIGVVKIGELSQADFVGSSPDVYDKQSLIYHLGLIYNLALTTFSDDSLVTKINFTYEGSAISESI